MGHRPQLWSSPLGLSSWLQLLSLPSQEMGLAAVATCPRERQHQVEDREARAGLELEPRGLGAILGLPRPL